MNKNGFAGALYVNILSYIMHCLELQITGVIGLSFC